MPASAFPQPVRSFAGRRAELDRILGHLDHDVLYFVYGVGGIGKSELVYQVMQELRARPRWADATPVLVEVRPGASAARVLAELLAAVGSGPAPRRGQPTAQAHLSEQLGLLARSLDARPHLVFIDDAHHLPADEVAEALGYLARRVRASRLLVASRRELPLPADAPAPVVTTLGPLEPAAAVQMMTALAERLAIPIPEPEAMLRATHGSPFHIHRMLVRHAPDAGSLEASLAALSPAARRVLVAVATAQHRPAVDVLRGDWSAGTSLDDALRELAQQFLLHVDEGRLVVHDLIREALLGAATPDELAAAHRDAAELCLGALRTGPGRPLLIAVDAVSHLLAAGRPAEAWSVVERWHSPLAAAGSEHLLLEPLERLRAALPARRVAIDLLIARFLVRASLFEDAGRVLAGIGDGLADTEAVRRDVLAGELAQRAGQLARAEELFERAAQRAPDPDARFQARLRSASAAVFAGDGERARRVVEAALADLPAPTPRQRARAGWARTVSWMFDERYQLAAEEARRARAQLADDGPDDLANQLAMLETLAWVEAEGMEQARAAALGIDESGLRQRVAGLYRAILEVADGQAREASARLVKIHEVMRAQGDTVHAYLAGFYGSAALAEIGKLGEAQALSARTTQLARAAGLERQTARSLAQEAILAAEGLQAGAAHRLADQALASRHIGPRSRATAHCAHVRACTIEGDIAMALEHVALARAAVAGPEHAAATAAIDVEQAAVDLVGGALDRAVELAERAILHYRGRSRDYETARARLVLAAAYLARGRRTDVLFAERSVTEARELADRARLRSIQVGCAILSAALAQRHQRERAARDLLADALRELDPERGSIYAGVLLAAIDGGVAARAAPGVVALLAHLGFAEAVDCYLVDRHGRRAATEKDLARERAERELFVDESREVIVARRGAVEIKGRPMLVGLLSTLVQARGEPVAPDTLYKQVWGVPEYHSLQHRNALYVAIKRLRASLAEALPDKDPIERSKGGWRLADDVDACVAVAVRQRHR
jgi:hypothetical protein